QGNNDSIPLAIVLGSGNDTLTLKDDVTLIGIVDCGEFSNEDPDFGTIIFNMSAPANEITSIENQIAAADPDGDSITINDRVYTWESCSALEAQLIPAAQSVPTTSARFQVLLILLLGGLGAAMIVGRRVIG
ncbi:MAG: hypothetical protein AAGH65_04400, partial [Pseudomonadota bacterium]